MLVVLYIYIYSYICLMVSPLAFVLSPTDPTTVSVEELLQHKNYIKVTKRQEKEIKELEKKLQKKQEDLIQKSTDSFKAYKKKGSLKKKE